jgi:hypothetical protein
MMEHKADSDKELEASQLTKIEKQVSSYSTNAKDDTAIYILPRLKNSSGILILL